MLCTFFGRPYLVAPLAQCVVCRLSSVCDVFTYCGETVRLSEKLSEGANRVAPETIYPTVSSRTPHSSPNGDYPI